MKIKKLIKDLFHPKIVFVLLISGFKIENIIIYNNKYKIKYNNNIMITISIFIYKRVERNNVKYKLSKARAVNHSQSLVNRC